MILKRTLTHFCALAALTLAMTSCAAQTQAMPSPSPEVSATTLPTDTAMPTTENSPTTVQEPAGSMAEGVTDPDRARELADEMKEQLEQLSEVTDAVVVVADDMAVVGLTFDTQYQAGMTDRVQEMVTERVQAIHGGVKRVAVTAKESLVDRITTLADQAGNATDLTEVQTEVEKLVDEIGGGTAAGRL